MTDPHKEIVNGCEFRMIYVEGGAFEMGSPDNGEAYFDERPRHQVMVPDFYIGKYPVTQALWTAIMDGDSPSAFKEENCPVGQVSWDDVHQFIKTLNELTNGTRPAGYLYRLPTEAEWE
ncbi:MAG: formylglycine-generating enzyme family protein, partial [Saprospiraceae bacterium]|nr:formylglycine-generating enzyme family protein [Saprospiraceae bacterium]